MMGRGDLIGPPLSSERGRHAQPLGGNQLFLDRVLHGLIAVTMRGRQHDKSSARHGPFLIE
jgi:hypothetical protein